MPFDFILDLLYSMDPTTKKMFGQHAIYIGDKIYLAVRKNDKRPIDNGLWIGTDFEYHESLMKQFPSIKTLTLYNIKKWLVLPEEAEDFETVAAEICELIKKGDKRIGVAKNKT